MTKNKRKKKAGWTSLEAEAKRLKARLRKIEQMREMLPEEIASDPKAVVEWLRKRRTRKRRTQ